MIPIYNARLLDVQSDIYLKKLILKMQMPSLAILRVN
jgi:hypothetical protein